MARLLFLDMLERFLHSKPLQPPLSAIDREFLGRFCRMVAEHQADPAFTTEIAASGLGMSRMHLNRKLQALTGKSTHQYILETRLETAHGLLPQGGCIASIATRVGFRSPSHFSKAFRKRYGTLPSACRAGQFPRRPSTHGRSPPEN